MYLSVGFLSGRKTIPVCRKCNSHFGHSFEGRASNQLKSMQVYISHFGLDLSKNPATWPASLVVDGICYDLASGPEGAQYLLRKPTVDRDAQGRIVGGRARSRSEANKLRKKLIASGEAKEVEIYEAPSPVF